MKRLFLASLLVSSIAYAGDPNRVNPTFFIARGVNLNAANTDVANISIPFYTKYIIRRIVITNVSGDLGVVSTCTIGAFTGAGGTGTTIISSGVVAGLRNSSNFVDLTLSVTSTVLTSSSIFIRIVTAQGSPMTGDIYIFIDPLDQ